VNAIDASYCDYALRLGEHTTTLAEYFRDYAPKYGSFALRAMPRYEEMLTEIVRCLPVDASEALELGCGTGSLTALLARQYPAARITAIDAADEMIARARTRIGAFALGNRVSFVSSFFEDFDLKAQEYDLIASNMSLHHVQDKGPFYSRLHGALKPGGLFVLGDELAGALPELQKRNWDGWMEFALKSGNLTGQEIEEIVQHEEKFDFYETLPRQFELLAGAGFPTVDCTWRYLNYAVFVAQA
jgi:tRNA (cmo5U34)-methyltransferase